MLGCEINYRNAIANKILKTRLKLGRFIAIGR